MKTVNALPYLLVKSVFRSRNITINHFKAANCQPVSCNRLTIGCFGAIMQVIEVPTETMKQSGGVSSEFQVPKTQFTVAQGCDDLCKMCPNNISSVCTSLEKVALMDSAVLSICNLAYRNMFRGQRLRAKHGNGFLKRTNLITFAPAANGLSFAGVRRFAMNNAKEMKKNYKTIDLVYIALGAVLITICSWISIPTTVPFTMQTFAVFFVLSALGGKRGTVAIIVYVLLGAVGIPVFAQFTSGIGILFGNTGGYIVGFIFMGLVYWLIVHFLGKKVWVEFLAMVIGLAVCYSFGTVWFMIVYAQANGAVGLAMVLAWCVIPFIIPDLIKLGLALTLARRLSPVLKLQ